MELIRADLMLNACQFSESREIESWLRECQKTVKENKEQKCIKADEWKISERIFLKNGIERGRNKIVNANIWQRKNYRTSSDIDFK